MTTTNLLTEYWNDLPDGTPVLILTPSGDKLACSPRVDADGTLVLIPEGHSERDMDTEFAEMRAAAEDAEVRCVRAENALAVALARVNVLETEAAAHTQGHAEQYFEHTARIRLLEQDVELKQVTITNLRGLAADLEQDYVPALFRAKTLLAHALSLHQQAFWVAPVGWVGEVDALIACINRLENRKA